MRIQIQTLFYFLTAFMCNAQNNISELFEKCNSDTIKDSVSLFDRYNDFTLALPKQWNGEFKGDSPSLFAYKISDSYRIRLIGNKAYDVQGDNNELQKKDPNFIGVNFIESEEIVIVQHADIEFNDKIILKYVFHCKIEKIPWIWKFYLSSEKDLTSNDICEIKHIIKQFIQRLKTN